MLVKEVKKIISNEEFSHCTDGILSLVLDKPRTEIDDNDYISEEEAKNI